jgi:hypothetical protein
MEYTYRLHPRVMGQIAKWGLSDNLLVDVYLALREELPSHPSLYLIKDPDDSPGMLYPFDRVDPNSPRFKHCFVFRIFYDANETILHVVRGSYYREYRG